MSKSKLKMTILTKPDLQELPADSFIRREEQFSAPFLWEITKRVPINSKYILDIGCGSGQLLFLLDKRWRKLWGIDIASNKIEAAFNKTRLLKSDVHLLNKDFLKYNLPSSYFDVIVSSFAIHNMPFMKAINIICTILRPGGEIVLLDIERKYKIFTNQMVNNELNRIDQQIFKMSKYWENTGQDMGEWLFNSVKFYETPEMKKHINRPHYPILTFKEIKRRFETKFSVVDKSILWDGIYLIHLRKNC